MSIESRKADHIRIALEREVSSRITPGFEDVELIHNAVCEVDFNEIDTTVMVMGKRLRMPLIIEALTGGTPEAKRINMGLAEVAESEGIGIGVGSVRAALEDQRLVDTYSIVRDRAPNALVISNIGAAQVAEYGLEYALKAMELVKADSLAIHFNKLQELVMPEGETRFKGYVQHIVELSKRIGEKLCLKETGAGFSGEAAMLAESWGVEWVDVAGAGGTSWYAVEYYRAKERNDEKASMLDEVFWDWGIPTVVSIIESRICAPRLRVIASGGVRTGLDAAKAIVLGASCVGMARPFLIAFSRGGVAEARRLVKSFELALRSTMFLVGARNITELMSVPFIVRGKTAEWLERRGLLEKLAGRMRYKHE
ncbi:MAG: type 2 isopentenyl-diphosphate Delta-isomerase [Candidatus Brockarchaeota archaeon]|nr:type 2 isopentenyl-diphosphate Delta-isomerase [Candidatus Brockarchaeota archaeon]